jgi:hypothetical protein
MSQIKSMVLHAEDKSMLIKAQKIVSSLSHKKDCFKDTQAVIELIIEVQNGSCRKQIR